MIKEYAGTGAITALAAIKRAKRDAERDARWAERARVSALDSPLDRLNELADLVAAAALLAAGFHQHHRNGV